MIRGTADRAIPGAAARRSLPRRSRPAGSRAGAGAVLAAATVLLVVTACAHGPAPAPKDPARGEYYSAEEIARLPAAERDRYCGFMATTLQERKTQARMLQARLDSLTALSDTLRAREVRISTRMRGVSERVRELRLQEKAGSSYIVAAGDNLKKIARELFGDGTRWKEIYEANRAVIGAEDAPLKAGTRLTIPRAGSRDR